MYLDDTTLQGTTSVAGATVDVGLTLTVLDADGTSTQTEFASLLALPGAGVRLRALSSRKTRGQ